MRQQCYVAAIYLNWALLIGGLIFFLYKGSYAIAAVWVIALPLAMWGYIRVFPSISKAMGYGEVRDEPAGAVKWERTDVRLYTAAGCPFCPIVRRRLVALREQMGFGLEEIDVTLKPGVLAAKKIRAVPVVEVGERQLVGNSTSDELARLISRASRVAA